MSEDIQQIFWDTRIIDAVYKTSEILIIIYCMILDYDNKGYQVDIGIRRPGLMFSHKFLHGNKSVFQ